MPNVQDMNPDDALAMIAAMREMGQAEAALSEEPHFVLVAYYSYPNGTTGDELADPKDIATVRERMGLPAPDDPTGHAIWYVPDSQGSKDWG